MHEPLMREVDLSTPFPVPEDRPLRHAEQVALWRDIMHPPPPTPEAERAIASRYGWLLNRLDWDREWVGPTEGCYYVPDCCKPGASRMPRAKLARMRREAQATPAFTPQGMAHFGALDPEDLGWEEEPF